MTRDWPQDVAEAVAVVRELLDAAPAFRSKPMGGEGSPVRRQQEAHIAAEDKARAFLSKFRAGAA